MEFKVGFEGVEEKFNGCLRKFLNQFQVRFKGVLRNLQGSFKVSKKKFKG